MSAEYTFRDAVVGDGETLRALVHALAVYERAGDEVRAEATDFDRALTEGCSAILVFASSRRSAGSEAVGFALWFPTFSTWLGRPGMFLEDLFVAPEHRGKGLGVALLARLAAIAVARDYRRFEWRVLDWNTPSIAFYERLGAAPLREWYTYRLEGAPLKALAARAVPNESDEHTDC